MKLDALNNSLLYLERYVDEHTKTYSRFAGRSDVATQYRPESDATSFELMSVQVPIDRVSIWKGDPAPELNNFYIQSDTVRFVIHPETWQSADVECIEELRKLPALPPITVAPTASTRTVLAFDRHAECPEHFLKLHYPWHISRFKRRLRRININNGIAISNDLVHVARDKFAYLPEVLGFTYGTARDSWGFIVRERTPRPIQGRPRILIPCFSLYADDLKNPVDPPLLIQIIEHLGADAQSFVLDKIMIPIVECWATAVRERGILLESHAQNLLLELDDNLVPSRIVHRDFDVWIDFDRRRRQGLDMPFLGRSLGSAGEPSLQQHYSLIYDRFIGSEFFEYLLRTVQRFYTIDERSMRRSVAEAFHSAFPDASGCFPADTTFYFSDLPEDENHFALVDTKEPPRWR